ncbi:MAG: M23 family metallopeptidase [Rectinemataceae bacterium]
MALPRPFGKPTGEGPRRGLRALVAIFSLVVLLASGAAAGDSAFPYDQGGGGLPSARFAVRVLQPGGREKNPALPPDAGGLRELIREAREGGIDTGNVVASSFPPPSAVLALLSVERDIDNFEEDAAQGGIAGSYYGREALLARRVKPLFRTYVSLFTAAYEELGGPTAAASLDPASAERMRDGVLPYGPACGINAPPRWELADAHPFALDLFFSRVDCRGDGQEGPAVPSLSGGIVVATARDWKGGAGIESWRGGGLSPSAGNGVIVYDPVSRRFYSYFHFRTTSLRPGDMVRPGSPLGIGGDTGMNARRPGHGGHVHIEIYDAAREKALSSYGILDLATDRH